MNKIAILLSTYNGEKFIADQLNSLLSQTYQDYIIYARDDGSSDRTSEILSEYKLKYSDKIKIIEKGPNIGIRHSFEKLMLEASNENYFAFCDQDDIWLKDKLEKLLVEMHTIEAEQQNNVPVLLFSDMAIMDENNKIIHPSFLNYFHISKANIDHGLFRGLISGCLMFYNKAALIEYFKQNRDLLHDHNLFITTFLYGKIGYTNEILVKYKIHENNYYGLSKKNATYILFLDLIKYFFNNDGYRKIALRSYFNYINTYIREENKYLCNSKELYSEHEISLLPYLERKAWYVRHFKPFGENKLMGLINLILI